MTIGGGKKIPRTSLPASLATTPRSLEQWKQYIEMRKLVCIVGQQAGAARHAPRRGTQPRVCLSSNRVPLSPSPTSLTPPPSRFPRSFFHSRLCLLPFVPVGYVRVPDSLPSSLLSLSSISPLCRAQISSFFLSPFFPPIFFPPRGDGIPASFPIGRLKERIVNRRMSRGFRNGDCSIRRFLLLYGCRAPARASDGWMDGWSTHDARNASIGN